MERKKVHILASVVSTPLPDHQSQSRERKRNSEVSGDLKDQEEPLSQLLRSVFEGPSVLIENKRGILELRKENIKNNNMSIF